MLKSFALATVILFSAGALLSADNWPQFRGLTAGAVPDDPALPDTWGPDQNIVWKLDVPGYAWSSPVVWGDHIFITSAINTKGEAPLKEVPSYLARSLGGGMAGADITTPADPHRWMVYDVDFKTGKIRWERQVQMAAPTQARHQKNSYASETPATDGERVYAYFTNAGLFAFDLNGKPVWSKPMDTLKMRTGWGGAASPIVHDGRVYIVNDNEEHSFLAAFDAKTGAEVWRVDRDEASNWTTPYVWDNGVRTEIVVAGTKKLRSYDLKGTVLWELGGLTSLHVPTPFAVDGLLYVQSGYPTDAQSPRLRIRPGATGDITLKPGETSNEFVVWSNPALGYLRDVIPGLRRLLLHTARPRISSLQRRQNRQGNLRTAAHRDGCDGIYRLAVGVQRQGIRDERRRRYLRDAGRARVQGAAARIR